MTGRGARSGPPGESVRCNRRKLVPQRALLAQLNRFPLTSNRKNESVQEIQAGVPWYEGGSRGSDAEGAAGVDALVALVRCHFSNLLEADYDFGLLVEHSGRPMAR